MLTALLLPLALLVLITLGAILLIARDKDFVTYLLAVMLFSFTCVAIHDVVVRGIEHKKIMETQDALQAVAKGKDAPFEATGFSARRLIDGRVLLSFTRPHAEDGERFFFVDVILPPMTAKDLTPILEDRQWQEKKEK